MLRCEVLQACILAAGGSSCCCWAAAAGAETEHAADDWEAACGSALQRVQLDLMTCNSSDHCLRACTRSEPSGVLHQHKSESTCPKLGDPTHLLLHIEFTTLTAAGRLHGVRRRVQPAGPAPSLATIRGCPAPCLQPKGVLEAP